MGLPPRSLRWFPFKRGSNSTAVADVSVVPATTSIDRRSMPDRILVGAAAGLLAGLVVALVDATRLGVIAADGLDWSLPWYAASLYGPLLALGGAGLGLAGAIIGRLTRRPAPSRARSFSSIGLSLFYVAVLAIGYFFLFRDVFEEKETLTSPKFLGAFSGLALGLAVLITIWGCLLRRLLVGSRERRATSPLAALAIYVAVTTGVWGVAQVTTVDGRAELPPVATEATRRPNVVIVLADTLRADHVGAYGNRDNLTPRLDAIAKEGVLFRHAYAQSSWTRPSVATILSGRFPSSHTATLKGSILPDSVTTLPEVLSAAGYFTLGVVSNYNLTPFFNFDQGFHEYRYLAPRLPLGANDTQSKLVLVEIAKKISARLAGQRETPEDYYVVGEDVTRIALERLDQRPQDRPFFLFVSYMDPHDPYFRHPFDGYAISHRATPRPALSLAAEMKKLYAGEVRYWDEAFGKLVDGLSSRRLLDDTLLVVVSDHGEEFGEHGGFWHGTTLYDEQLGVVFVARFPARSGVAGGAVVDDWMRLVDTAPFVLSNVGVPTPAEMQGRPHPSSTEPVFAEEDHEGNILSSVRYRTADGVIKLIVANPGNPRGLPPTELFRLDHDAGEKENLSTKEPVVVQEARERLGRMAAKAGEGKVEAQTGQLSREAAEQLKNLGYMDEDTHHPATNP